jgi:hypothetical protein
VAPDKGEALSTKSEIESTHIEIAALKVPPPLPPPRPTPTHSSLPPELLLLHLREEKAQKGGLWWWRFLKRHLGPARLHGAGVVSCERKLSCPAVRPYEPTPFEGKSPAFHPLGGGGGVLPSARLTPNARAQLQEKECEIALQVRGPPPLRPPPPLPDFPF